MLRRVLLALIALALASVQAHAQLLPGRAPGFRPGFQFIGGAGGFPASGAVLDYDFKGDRYSGPAISVSRASPAYIDDSAGNWTLVAANALRRSDKGALIEGAQTNSVRNNSMQGAVAGSPGTLPNLWVASLGSAALSRQVVGVGTLNGVDYIDLRVFGTASNSGAWLPLNLQFESAGAVAAATGQLWTISAFVQLVAGSLPSNVQLELEELTSSNANVRYNAKLITPDNTFRRYEFNSTLSGGSTTAGVRPGIWIYGPTTANVPIDFTIRVGWPQLEQWSSAITTVGGASSPIRTTGTAATRAADAVSASLTGFSVPLTVAGVIRSAPFALAGAAVPARIGTSSTASYRTLLNAAGGSVVGGETGSAGVDLGAQPSAGTRFAFAFAGDAAGQSGSLNGGAVVGIATGLTAGHTFLGIGGNGDGSAQTYGYIERLALWPYRAANDNVRTYGTLSNWGG
ncbi:phage head spike fiber domain-containing protein [Methylobacterium gossipiicola]|uniref:Uncharacterized protein n=1 Tax=Methylobacterium gossipiicola TaxID=582675 RepID=A0A1I2TRR8_9HYPH|nr:hypothetical protein [Methylobacterium gossipiicola]SFG65041.1 hypothetical protein SAMN05192565_107154 [Methylobacterium gossipiicola]